MEKQKEKINIRGSMNLLEVEGLPLELAKCDYKLSVIRSTAFNISNDTGKKFSVTTSKKMIIVKRIS